MYLVFIYLFFCFLVSFVSFFFFLSPEMILYLFIYTARLFRGKFVERFAKIRNLIADLRSENGRISFPRSIEGNVDITGKGRRHFLGQLVQNVRLPIVEELRNGQAGRKQQMKLKVRLFFIIIKRGQ